MAPPAMLITGWRSCRMASNPPARLQLAMKDARINEEEVQYINFHGTSTVINDKIETLAVKGALNGHAMKVPVSSTKSMVGHPQGASGALGTVVTALSLRDGVLSPTINMENPDPDCDMDYIANESRDQRFRWRSATVFHSGPKTRLWSSKSLPSSEGGNLFSVNCRC